MTDKNDMAFPIDAGEGNFSAGLSKRELFAALQMAGMFSNELVSGSEENKAIAADAVSAADALIEALNK